MKNAFRIFLIALLLFIFEYVIYTATQMREALSSATLAAVVAYKFKWFMVFTLAVGILAPLAALVQRVTQKSCLGFVSWMVAIWMAMILFTALSFLKARSAAPPATVSPSPVQITGELSKPAEAAKRGAKISEVLQFVGSKVELPDEETLKINLEFKNLSSEEFTELDYAFTAVENGHIFYRIKMRESVYIPANLTASTSLSWQRSALQDPKLFEQFRDAYKNTTLKIFARPLRAVRVDGGAIEE